MTESVQALRQQLQQLRARHASGALGDAKYAEKRAALERRLVDMVVDEPLAANAVATPGSPAAGPTRAGLRLWAGLGGCAIVLAAAGYWWTGSPDRLNQTPAGFGDQAAAGSDASEGAPHAMDSAQVSAMVERLAARLKDQPDDADGWTMLGRTYMALGRQDEALAAFERVAKLRPDDAGSLADYADALALKNDRNLDGEPTKLIERALKLDPGNLKALTLAGTAAFNRGDYAKAAQYFDRAVKVGPPDNPIVQQASNAAAEARERGKLAPAAGASDKAPATTTPGASTTAAGVAGAISGTVTLAPGLRGKAAAEDTVFIFARPAQGSRVPIAIVRKQVKDLPFTFRLDDSLAMSPASLLSTAGSVIVGARISKSGQAMPQPGDLEGLTGSTAVGSAGVAVVIANEVK